MTMTMTKNPAVCSSACLVGDSSPYLLFRPRRSNDLGEIGSPLYSQDLFDVSLPEKKDPRKTFQRLFLILRMTKPEDIICSNSTLGPIYSLSLWGEVFFIDFVIFCSVSFLIIFIQMDFSFIKSIICLNLQFSTIWFKDFVGILSAKTYVSQKRLFFPKNSISILDKRCVDICP